MPLLTDNEIEARLTQHSSWTREGDSIVRDCTFPDFPAAIRAVNAIAAAAEERNHHPDMLIQYNRVRLTLSTHSEGGVTGKDFELAAGIDLILS